MSVVARSTVIDVNITNDGSVIVPVNEVWVFLDGENARNLATLSPIADSEYIYPGDTVGVVWRGLGNTVFETAALSCKGFNTARTLD
jgi:archaellum component FlaF (FlaF/FlaG flagellin family)